MLCPALVRIIGILNAFQVELIPVMGSDLLGVTQILIDNAIPEGVGGRSQLPGKHVVGMVGVSDDRRIAPYLLWFARLYGWPAGRPKRAILTHKPVLATNLPVVLGYVPIGAVGVTEMLDAGKEPLGAWAIAGGTRPGSRHRHEVLGTRKEKGIFCVVVNGNSLRGLATYPWDAQTPTKTERPIAIAGTIDEIQLGLKAVATRRESNGHREVSRPRE